MLSARTSTLPRAFARCFSATPRPQVAKMTVVGRIGAEPEVVSTQSGQDVVRYVVGTRSGSPDNELTSWWRIACFAPEGNKMRENLLRLPKGTLVYVEGEASMRKFERDGKTESALSIVQRDFKTLRKPDSAQREASSESGEESSS